MVYTKGQIIYYKTEYENKENVETDIEIFNNIRQASEIHYQTRSYIKKFIKPGVKIFDICEKLESKTNELIKADGLKRGIAFPTGISINNCAAHDTASTNDERTLNYNDVVKIDFGNHINGQIIDCAFTITFNPQYDKLLEAVRESTNIGIKEIGIDVRVCDIGASINEVMSSYEVEINGHLYPVKPIRNLCGHSIDTYKLHAGITIPLYDNKDQTKLKQGFYAVETFGSTGEGIVYNDHFSNCSHFMKNYNFTKQNLNFLSSKKLLSCINKNFSTLAFCKRQLDKIANMNYLLGLKELCDKNIIKAYPALLDIPNSMTAQYEHTVALKEYSKEILTKRDDF